MRASRIIQQFEGKHVLVLGDVMLDAYLIGKVSRISPEAPVPIVGLQQEDQRLGGAANVALNLVSLGAKTTICSVIGNDSEGRKLIDLLHENEISSEGIIDSPNRKTTIKTRVLADHQQLIRIDSEQCDDISSELTGQLIKKIEQLLQNGVDALIFEDYNKGVLTEELIQQVIALCKKYQVITTVDPKKKNFFSYQGVDLFKPNLKELKEGLDLQFDIQDRDSFRNAVKALQQKLAHRITFITLSEHGVFIDDQQEEHFLPAHLRNISDVSGAGDTVISVATLCMCIDLPIEKVAAISNLAGGLVCEKSGVVSILPQELMQQMENLDF
ncbi:MAG: D-glycero-beta-D-manno-heptose-7-phosphate kinase [Bacteroidetes bacterium]|nr:MAG: D-glycero-beta-D-manno-heptose-7-phosphate kinase [Bacteroidota bacterium]